MVNLLTRTEFAVNICRFSLIYQRFKTPLFISKYLLSPDVSFENTAVGTTTAATMKIKIFPSISVQALPESQFQNAKIPEFFCVYYDMEFLKLTANIRTLQHRVDISS